MGSTAVGITVTAPSGSGFPRVFLWLDPHTPLWDLYCARLAGPTGGQEAACAWGDPVHLP